MPRRSKSAPRRASLGTILTEPASVGNLTIGGDQPLGSKSATISLDIEGNEGNLVFDPKGGNATVGVATVGKNLGAIFGSMSLDNALGSLSLSLDDSDGYFLHSLDVSSGGIYWESGSAFAGSGTPVSLQFSTRDYTVVPSAYLGHGILVTAVTPIGVVINAADEGQTTVDGTPGSLNVNGGDVAIDGAFGPNLGQWHQPQPDVVRQLRRRYLLPESRWPRDRHGQCVRLGGCRPEAGTVKSPSR